MGDTRMRKPAIVAALIAAAAVIIAALIQIVPSVVKTSRTETYVITGMVVDQETNRGLSQAAIYFVGRTEQYTTEDNGNFRIALQADSAKLVRLHVTKAGYLPLDESVQAPADNLILQLRKP